MRIVIDMQGAQTESRFRGIGRYTVAFAQAVVRNKGEHEIILALSGLFPDTIEPIRAAFDGLLTQENIRVWHAPGPVSDYDLENTTRREVAELIREAFLASLCPDIIHVCSLFEGFVDDAVTSIGRFDDHTPVTVTLYDLIPALNPDQFLTSKPNYRAHYEKKLNTSKKAKQLLAISEHTKQEGLNYLEVDAKHIVNVSTAIGPEFKPIEVDVIAKEELFRKNEIVKPFVLWVGASGPNKNLPRLIEAWSKLPIEVRKSHQLLLVGKINKEEIRRVARRQGLRDTELLFGGYLSDDELVQIYNLCTLFVLPSFHEGFGLPALEAMACGAPVIGSNTTSLPEVIGLAEALFDPFNTDAICFKLQEVLTNQDLLIHLKSHGLRQSKKFSWDKSAQLAITAWENLLVTRSSAAQVFSLQQSSSKNLINAISFSLTNCSDKFLISLSANIALNEHSAIQRQLFLDISELVHRDAATGIQRVVKNYLINLVKNPPKDFRVLPVYATTSDCYRYANAYIAKKFGINSTVLVDSPITWQRGDIFFGLDLQHQVQLSQAVTYERMRNDGVIVQFLVYDLLPIQLKELFENENLCHLHEKLMQLIGQQHQAICISKTTADTYKNWLQEKNIAHNPMLVVDWVHMGADLEVSHSSRGLPKNSSITLKVLKNRPTFLSVSTLEPRKALTQILDAVEILWANHQDINLVFVGQQGWKVETLVERITNHPENGKRLFWLKDISDEYLELVYQASTCLVAASINEGFGLPLIEAARHGVPVIARDIPVFREVAKENAYYFNGDSGDQLADAMTEWLQLFQKGLAPNSTSIRRSTWQESTEHLKTILIKKNLPHRQLLVDISELIQYDHGTGIQRVTRAILKNWLLNPPLGFKVEPVYATVDKGYRYATDFTRFSMGGANQSHPDAPMKFAPGDIFFGLDLNHHIPRVHRAFLENMHKHGVDVRFMVYDLLPIQFPHFFEPQHSVHLVVAEWLSVITSLSGAICISKTVAEDLAVWMKNNSKASKRNFNINWFHLGADIDQSLPTKCFIQNEQLNLDNLRSATTFLMVGTLEPRKGHARVLDAFEKLWQDRTDLNLIIVGKKAG